MSACVVVITHLSLHSQLLRKRL